MNGGQDVPASGGQDVPASGDQDVPAPHRTVRGQVALPEGGPGERAACVVIAVEDVSRMDAPSIVVREQRLEDVPLDGQALRFEIEVPEDEIDPRGMYSLRVHVDMNGSGRVEQGDAITTQSYPVLTGHSPDVADTADTAEVTEVAEVAVRRI